MQCLSLHLCDEPVHLVTQSIAIVIKQICVKEFEARYCSCPKINPKDDHVLHFNWETAQDVGLSLFLENLCVYRILYLYDL